MLRGRLCSSIRNATVFYSKPVPITQSLSATQFALSSNPNSFTLTFQPVGLGKIAHLINAGKIDSSDSELITMKTLKDAGAIGKQIKDGVRLMGRGSELMTWPVHLEKYEYITTHFQHIHQKMQVIPRWRNLQILKNSFVTSSSTHSASFHSTPLSLEKWKNKWNSDVGSGQRPSKNHIRYATRQKRADTKKALKNLLFNNASYPFSVQDECPRGKANERSSWDASEEDHSDSFDKKGRSKSSARCASKANHKRMKRKFKRERFSEDFDEHPDTVFQATIGNRWYTWSFSSRDESFQSSTSNFEWRDQSNWRNRRKSDWETTGETESSSEVGSSSDRSILGLPSRGHLKIEDVKNAFRALALKWHPDKHQGPSQAMAEEQFKVCVDAYKSLCSALASA